MPGQGNRSGFWAVLVVVAIAAGVIAYQRQAGRTVRAGGGADTVKIAMSGVYPPFNYFNERNALVGFDVDIAKEIARRLNREPELVTTAWDGILAGLVSHKFDLIIGSMAITEERKKTVLFSDPYYSSGAQLVTRKGSKISGPSSLKGKVVGVTVGETYEAYVREHIPGVKRIATYKGGVPNLIMELNNKRIDAFLTDRLVGLYALKQAKSDAVLSGDLLYREEMGIAVAREHPELLAEVNAALAAMKEDGTYARISDTWFGRNILALE
jgi:polar amino acid transport system substrate-binding protein